MEQSNTRNTSGHSNRRSTPSNGCHPGRFRCDSRDLSLLFQSLLASRNVDVTNTVNYLFDLNQESWINHRAVCN